MRNFKGDAKSSRRLFVVAADLSDGDNNTEPWCQVSRSNTAVLEQQINFMLKQSGHADLLIAFDGRMRDARRCIEDKFVDRQHVAEGMITYSGKCKHAPVSKKIVWQIVRVETAIIAFPMNRTRLPTKDREAFADA